MVLQTYLPSEVISFRSAEKKKKEKEATRVTRNGACALNVLSFQRPPPSLPGPAAWQPSPAPVSSSLLPNNDHSGLHREGGTSGSARFNADRGRKTVLDSIYDHGGCSSASWKQASSE